MTRNIARLAIVLLILPALVGAQASQAGDPCFASGIPFAGESLTVSTTALPFTQSVYDQLSAGTGFFNATAALLCVNTNAINVRSDGTAPTATVGVPLSANACQCIGRASFAFGRTRMIRQSADSVVFVTYIAPSN